MPLKRMPARMESLAELMVFIVDQAQKKDFSQDGIDRVRLVVEEALVNVFNHAYPAVPGHVEVCVNESDGASLVVEICDTGIPFNPLSLPEPDLDADVSRRNVGGLGVYFIRQMVDRAQYRREGDSNILTLIFSDRRRD